MKQIDRETVHHLLLNNVGKLDLVTLALNQAGYDISQRQLSSFINKDRVLRAVWFDNQVISETEAPDETAIVTRRHFKEEGRELDIQKIQEEYTTARGLADSGVPGEDIHQVLAVARLASESFSATVDMTHGIMITGALELKKRANHILIEILNNEEVVDKVVKLPDGSETVAELPKYSSEEKVFWQKEYTSIMDQLRRYAETANNAGKIRTEMLEAANPKRQRGGTPKRALRQAVKVNKEEG